MLHREDLRVPEAITTGPASLIGDEYLIACSEHVDEFELLDVLTGWPAVIHVACTAEPVIERTDEAEFIGEQRLDPCAVPLDVGVIDAACDGRIVQMLRQKRNGSKT